jgi:hypothetical protein
VSRGAGGDRAAVSKDLDEEVSNETFQATGRHRREGGVLVQAEAGCGKSGLSECESDSSRPAVIWLIAWRGAFPVDF